MEGFCTRESLCTRVTGKTRHHTQLWACGKWYCKEKCLSWKLRGTLPLIAWRKLKWGLFKTLWTQSWRSGLETGKMTSHMNWLNVLWVSIIWGLLSLWDGCAYGGIGSESAVASSSWASLLRQQKFALNVAWLCLDTQRSSIAVWWLGHWGLASEMCAQPFHWLM